MRETVPDLKTLGFLFAAVLLAPGTARSQNPAPIGSVKEARALSKADLASGKPIALESVVLAHSLAKPVSDYSLLFVHDGTEGIFVNAFGQQETLQPGTKVLVTGSVVAGDFAPAVGGGHAKVIGRGTLPAPLVAGYDDLLTGKEDSQWVQVSGIVRAVSLVESQIRLELAMGSREIPVYVAGHVDSIPPEANLVDAQVTITGACITGFNPRGQILSAILMTPSLDMVELKTPPHPLEEIPRRSINALLSFTPGGVSGHRVKIEAVVTHCDPGDSVYLTDGRNALRALTKSNATLAPGTRVEAIGFPKPGLAAAVLDYSEFRTLGTTPPPKPVPVNYKQAISGDYEAALVSIVGRVVEQTRHATELRLLMDSGESVFPANLTIEPGQPPVELQNGSYLRLTGIALTEGEVERRGGAGFRPTAWHLDLRNAADIQIVRRPAWWTMQRVIMASAALAIVLLGTFLWIGALGRRVAAQTAVIKEKTQREATLEERNRIARELHDTLAQGFAGTAFTLEGIASMLRQDTHPALAHVEMALNMVRHSLTEARRSLMNLRAEALEFRDLASALKETASNLIGQSGVQLITDLKPPGVPLSNNEESNLFRIGVEAVTNAIRHGNPTRLHLSLHRSESTLELAVADDGAGFDPVQPSDCGHFGVLGMQERARLIHAELKILSQPGAGTKVLVTLPLHGEGEPRKNTDEL